MFTCICSSASMLNGCESVCPPSVFCKPNVLLKLAPFTVTLLNDPLRPPKLLLPLAVGVSLVKSCRLLLVVGSRSICWRLIISAEPVRLRLKTLSERRPVTTTSVRLPVLLVNVKSDLKAVPRVRKISSCFSSLWPT